MDMKICTQFTAGSPSEPGSWRFYVPSDGTSCNGLGSTVTVGIPLTYNSTNTLNFEIANTNWEFSGMTLRFASVEASGAQTGKASGITLREDATNLPYDWGVLSLTVSSNKKQATLQVTNENSDTKALAIDIQLTIAEIGNNILQTSADPQVILEPGN